MNPDVAIKVNDVKKSFMLPHEKHTSLKSVFTNVFKKNSYEEQKALRGISFEIKKGEFFGIVGRNGCGKSTLLKILAGIYHTTAGSVDITGKLTAFIELGVGFNPDLTGRENVFLNGALLGFTRKEVAAMYDDIVSFAELERFMDQKLKNYSSGMQVRLAFSIATRAQSDILLLDEVLAVGDSAFQQKCLDYFLSLKKTDKTIVLVSHNMPIVEQFCDRALLIEKGKIEYIGNSSEVASRYENMFMREEAERLKKERAERGHHVREDKSGIEIQDVEVLQHGKKTDSIEAGQSFDVRIKLSSENDVDKVNVGINIKNHDRVMLVSTDTLVNGGGISFKAGQKRVVNFNVQNILNNGVFTVSLGVADCSEKVQKILMRLEGAAAFTVKGVEFHNKSLAHPDVKVKVD